MEFGSEAYQNWLKTLQTEEKVGIRKEINGTIWTKTIMSISPRGTIQLKGFRHKFRKGRSDNGWRLEPITDEFLVELCGLKTMPEKEILMTLRERL